MGCEPTNSSVNNITEVELRYIGTNLTDSTFHYSLNDGVTWEKFSGQRVHTEPKHIGRKLKVKVILNETFNPQSPQLDGLGVLYK